MVTQIPKFGSDSHTQLVDKNSEFGKTKQRDKVLTLINKTIDGRFDKINKQQTNKTPTLTLFIYLLYIYLTFYYYFHIYFIFLIISIQNEQCSLLYNIIFLSWAYD